MLLEFVTNNINIAKLDIDLEKIGLVSLKIRTV